MTEIAAVVVIVVEDRAAVVAVRVAAVDVVVPAVVLVVDAVEIAAAGPGPKQKILRVIDSEARGPALMRLPLAQTRFFRGPNT